MLIKSDRTIRSKITSKVAKIRVRMVRVDVGVMGVKATSGVVDSSDFRVVNRASILTNKSNNKPSLPSKL